jgi:TolB-like protein
MGRNKTFLVPICVDKTPEQRADVPDSFSAVQWTRLPEGSPTPEFIARVARLLRSPLTATAAGSSPLVDRMPAAPLRSRRWIGMGIAVVVAATAIGYYVWRRGLTASSRATDTVLRQAVLPAVPEKSVAVLPFTDMSEKHDQEYLSDGLSEELIDRLTQVPNLRVTARTSSFYFKGRSVPIADIAKALNVANVLEGSVRKSGSTVRIAAHLVRADSGYDIWS